jgi:2-oxo-4-hydroxy-4-carboxy-5-ureidoimidazoline decarboxylase
VAAGRPYASADTLLTAAGSAMARMTDDDWLAVSRSHPRIGERGGDAPEASAREQVAVTHAAAATRAALAAENRQYEERFGHVFLIRAAGRSAEEILAELRRRIKNDDATELAEARRELAEIALLRLQKLLTD